MAAAGAKAQVLTKDWKEWMTLDEAKRFLGKSEKSVQRLKRAGHLHSKNESREGRAQRVYSGADLQRIKAEAIPASAIAPETSMAIAKVQAPVELAIPSATVTTLRDLVTEWRGPVERLWLSLEEAVAVSGLREGFLLTAISQSKIAALKAGFGGAWRINRASLEEFRG